VGFDLTRGQTSDAVKCHGNVQRCEFKSNCLPHLEKKELEFNTLIKKLTNTCYDAGSNFGLNSRLMALIHARGNGAHTSKDLQKGLKNDAYSIAGIKLFSVGNTLQLRKLIDF